MKKVDFPLLVSVIVLSLFGLFMIYDASSFVAFRDFGDKYRYVKDQSFWFVIGTIAMLFASRFDYKKYYNLALPALLVSIVLLILVFFPVIGVELLGARRWVNAGVFLLQPSEITKLSLAFYLSAWFSVKEKKRFLPFLMLVGLIIALVMAQPDMGTASIIFGEAVAIYFLSGGSILHILSLIPVAVVAGIGLIVLEPYRASRLTTFLNPHQDIQSSSYHVRQILFSLGSGGLAGVGLGNSLQKYAYLPESTTDSIFAIIAEEIGFLGSLVLIAVYVFVIWRGFYIAMHSKDIFGKLLAGGITTFIAIQTLVNLGAQTALLPLTGIPLPFISYGGSALIINLFSIGILLNISRQSK